MAFCLRCVRALERIVYLYRRIFRFGAAAAAHWAGTWAASRRLPSPRRWRTSVYFATGVSFFLRIVHLVQQWLNDFVNRPSVRWYYSAFPVLGQALYYNLILFALFDRDLHP